MSTNPFEGFADWMEQQEPGYKDRCAAERRQRATERLRRREALIELHGSAEAVTAPCERERKLHKALAPWITWCGPPGQRWVSLIDGECSPHIIKGVPHHIRAAMANAYPWPTTVAEAGVEFAYWRQRDQDFCDVLDEQIGDYALDRAAEFRMHIVDDLLMKELPVQTVADFQARSARFAAILGEDSEVASLHADFMRLVRRGAFGAQSHA